MHLIYKLSYGSLYSRFTVTVNVRNTLTALIRFAPVTVTVADAPTPLPPVINTAGGDKYPLPGLLIEIAVIAPLAIVIALTVACTELELGGGGAIMTEGGFEKLYPDPPLIITILDTS
jgi:hypothetical protein